MLAIVVAAPGRPIWRRTYATIDISIGRAPDNQLLLPGDRVAERHARLIAYPRSFSLTDLDSPDGTYVDRKRVEKQTLVTGESKIQIADYELTALRVTPPSVAGTNVAIRGRVEQQLLDAVVAGDTSSRLVYADWLESRGDDARAEFLRLQERLEAISSPDDPTIEELGTRLTEVASGIDVAWRSRVAHRTIEGCAFDFECPKEWTAMTPTGAEGVRHCSSCKKTVHYCASVEEARGHAAKGRCVALDVTSPRWDDDLEAPFGARVCHECNVDIGSGQTHCPRCGQNLVRVTMAGRFAAPRVQRR